MFCASLFHSGFCSLATFKEVQTLILLTFTYYCVFQVCLLLTGNHRHTTVSYPLVLDGLLWPLEGSVIGVFLYIKGNTWSTASQPLLHYCEEKSWGLILPLGLICCLLLYCCTDLGKSILSSFRSLEAPLDLHYNLLLTVTCLFTFYILNFT